MWARLLERADCEHACYVYHQPPPAVRYALGRNRGNSVINGVEQWPWRSVVHGSPVRGSSQCLFMAAPSPLTGLTDPRLTLLSWQMSELSTEPAELKLPNQLAPLEKTKESSAAARKVRPALFPPVPCSRGHLSRRQCA
jgi:hypothetical protein